jgi:hypothetical protein
VYGSSPSPSPSGGKPKKPFCECSTDPENNDTCSACHLNFQKNRQNNGSGRGPPRERQMSITVLGEPEPALSKEIKISVGGHWAVGF